MRNTCNPIPEHEGKGGWGNKIKVLIRAEANRELWDTTNANTSRTRANEAVRLTAKTQQCDEIANNLRHIIACACNENDECNN